MKDDTPMTMTNPRAHTALPRRQDFVAGLVIIGIALFAFWHGTDLPIGTLGGMGPGMLPKSLAVLLGLLGALLLVAAMFENGVSVEQLSIRGPILVLGAVVAFGLTIRPYGLLAAGPLAILISAFASEEV